MTTTYYVWDVDSDNYLAELEALTSTTTQFTHVPMPYGDLVSQWRQSGVDYFQLDGQNSIREVTDATQRVSESFVYSGFGEELVPNAGATLAFRYKGSHGYLFDTSSTLLFVRSRAYAHALGRWMSRTHANLQHDRRNMPNNADVATAYYVYDNNTPTRNTDSFVHIQPQILASAALPAITYGPLPFATAEYSHRDIKHKRCEICGNDITNTLLRFQWNFEKAFRIANDSQRLNACNQMDTPWGWDIWELAWYKEAFISGECGTSRCVDSVTVGRLCFEAAEVNYFLWGLASRLCADFVKAKQGERYSLVWALDRVALHKAVSTLCFGLQGRLLWTIAGYYKEVFHYGLKNGGKTSRCPTCPVVSTWRLNGYIGVKGNDELGIEANSD